MGIKFNNQFTVAAAPRDTYDLLVDVVRVAPCIPGATMMGVADDGSHQAEMAMRVGPMKLTFNGTVKLVDQDDDARSAVMVAQGRERRGQGTAQATMHMQVRAADSGGSEVTIDTDVEMVGRLAQIGSGIMADVAGRMITEMAGCIETTLEASTVPPAVSGDGPRGAGPGHSTTVDEGRVPIETTTAPADDRLARSTARPAPRATTPSVGALLWHIVLGRLRALAASIRRRLHRRKP